MDMGSTFTGTPAKKVQSVMALDTVVEHDAVMTDYIENSATDAVSQVLAQPAVAEPTHWWQKSVMFVSGLFGKLFGKQSVEAATEKHKLTQRPVASLLDVTSRGIKQDMARTAQATKDEAAHIVTLNSVWGAMEEEDKVEEEAVKGEDASERIRAMTPEAAHTLTKEELKERHGTDMSSFWGQLESQDGDIEMSVSNENLGEYQRLTKLQDEAVDTAATQLRANGLHTERSPTLHGNDNAFLSKTIHDKWQELQNRDEAAERKIHDSPDLQMLQLKHSRRLQK